MTASPARSRATRDSRRREHVDHVHVPVPDAGLHYLIGVALVAAAGDLRAIKGGDHVADPVARRRVLDRAAVAHDAVLLGQLAA
jgi:hypothetical protein